jgi:cytochrome c551/c552
MKWKVIGITVLLACIAVIAYERMSLARRGEESFNKLGCGGCHFGGAGPDLTHVLQKHGAAFLEMFIQDPRRVYTDRHGQTLNSGYMPMPNLGVSQEDAHAIVAYLKELNKQ